MIVFPSLFLSSMFGILSTYAQTFPTFLIIRFCEGFFFTGSTIIAWIFASECVSVQRRAKTLMLFGLFWVFGYCSIALIAKTTTDWRHATISMCVVVAVLAVMLWLYVFLAWSCLTHEHLESCPTVSISLQNIRVRKNLHGGYTMLIRIFLKLHC